MAGSAAQLSSNLANIIGGPVELTPGQQRMSAPRAGLARIGRGLFGSGEATIDITDPASLEAAAQAALEEGDQALAVQYMQQARAIRAEQRDIAAGQRAEAGVARADRAESRETAAQRSAAKAKVAGLHKENDAALQEIQDRSALLREAGQRGYNDIIAASRGMSTADISKAILARSKEGRDTDVAEGEDARDEEKAKLLMEQQVSALEGLAEQSGDPKIKRLAKAEANRVRAGGKFDTAYSTVTRAMGEDGPDGVIATEAQVDQIYDALQSIPLPQGVELDDLDYGDRFRIANQVVNAQRANPDTPIDELIVEVVGRYDPEDDSDKWGFQGDKLGAPVDIVDFEKI